MSLPPPGFERHFRQSPLTDPWEPLYSKILDDRVVIGLSLGTAHTNARGLAHGGLIAALADNAMGLSCGVAMRNRGQGETGGLLTVSLSLDYLGMARLGQWLEFDTGFTKTGASLCFAQAFVTADGLVIARADARFKTLAAPKA
jgi:acyl-coenzyme A thioesterase PaaI-like protein